MKPPESRCSVLMIAYACNPEGSGEHWLGWGWAEQAAKNFSVHLIATPNHQAAVEKHARNHGITAHFVAVPAGVRKISNYLGGIGSWLRKIAWQYRVVQLAEKLHAENKFHIVHQTTFHTFRVPFLAARLGIPSVWGPIAGGESVPPGFASDLGTAWFGEFGRKLINKLWLGVPFVRRSLKQVGTIFVSNRTTLNFLPAQFHAKCVVVPPNALRPEDESSASFSAKSSEGKKDSLRLVYVGNCVATRALPLVFAAMRERGGEHCRVTIVGSGPAVPRWKKMVESAGLSERVEFTGQVGREKLAGIYAAADALVFPALRDSGGSALLEAMARGLPVICLDWGGPGEMVDGQSGIKISVLDRKQTVRDLAEAMARLTSQPELRNSLARAGRARALSAFRWEAKALLLESTYRRLISGA